MIRFKSTWRHMKWSEGYILEDSPRFLSLQSCAAELQTRRWPFKKTLTSYLVKEICYLIWSIWLVNVLPRARDAATCLQQEARGPLICPSHPHMLATSIAHSRNYFKTSMCSFYISFWNSPVNFLTPWHNLSNVPLIGSWGHFLQSQRNLP